LTYWPHYCLARQVIELSVYIFLYLYIFLYVCLSANGNEWCNSNRSTWCNHMIAGMQPYNSNSNHLLMFVSKATYFNKNNSLLLLVLPAWFFHCSTSLQPERCLLAYRSTYNRFLMDWPVSSFVFHSSLPIAKSVDLVVAHDGFLLVMESFPYLATLILHSCFSDTSWSILGGNGLNADGNKMKWLLCFSRW